MYTQRGKWISQLQEIAVTSFHLRKISTDKPAASDVLKAFLQQRAYPHWTSYFVRYNQVIDDHRGQSSFNFLAGEHNYQILRTGCWPYIKYHCSKRHPEDLNLQDNLIYFLKITNFGIPCLLYGIAAIFLIRHFETVMVSNNRIYIYFLYKENPE